MDESSGTYGIFPGATAGAFSPDGKLFALGGSHVEVHALLYEGPGFHLYGTANPSALAFAFDSKSIGVYSKETHVYQLLRTEGSLQHVNEFDSVPSLLVDGQFRHRSPLKELTDVFHPTTGRNKGTFPTETSDSQDCHGPPAYGYSVVSPDGTRCAWWQTGTISIGTLMPRKALTCIPDPFSGRSPSTATFNATGTLLACGSSTGTESTVRVYQVSNRELIFERTYKSPLLHLALSGDGNRVAAAYKNGNVFWWRVDIDVAKNSGT